MMSQQPGTIGGIVPPTGPLDALRRRVSDLEQQLRALQTARSGEAMTIAKAPGLTVKNGAPVTILDGATVSIDDAGRLVFNDGSQLIINDGGSATFITPAGHVVFQIARTVIPDGSGRTQQTFYLGRDDGSAAFIIADLGTAPGHPHQQNWAGLDRGNNVVVAEDTVSGQGLAWPLIPLGDWMSNSYPTDTTNSAIFQTLNTLNGFKQQPRAVFQILARMDDPGTAGEIRVTDQDGHVVGGVTTISAGAYVSFQIGPADLAGSHGQAVALNLQGRVTSGPGSIGARGLAAWGQPS